MLTNSQICQGGVNLIYARRAYGRDPLAARARNRPMAPNRAPSEHPLGHITLTPLWRTVAPVPGVSSRPVTQSSPNPEISFNPKNIAFRAKNVRFTVFRFSSGFFVYMFAARLNIYQYDLYMKKAKLMKILKITLFLALCIVLPSCVVDYCEDEGGTINYVFSNDTEYDCTISWSDSKISNASETIHKQESFKQSRFIGNGSSGLCKDGRTSIVDAEKITINFAGSEMEPFTVLSDFDWAQLPKTEEIASGAYETTYKFYLSDILLLMQRADTTE